MKKTMLPARAAAAPKFPHFLELLIVQRILAIANTAFDT